MLIPEKLPGAVKKLIIVADGGLSLLPFEALLTDNSELSKNSSQWPFLIEKFDISYSPSVSIFINEQSKKNNQTEKSFLGFAPVFSHQVYTTNDGSNIFQSYLKYVYNSRMNNLGLEPLNASKKELIEIDSIFIKHHLKSDLYLNTLASEKNLISSDLKNFKYIHIASHGFIDKKRPELSGIFLSPVNNPGYDNILYTSEIYNLELNAELITLSACETALGKIAEGEGLLGFSRAFLYAGAKNVMLSLWKVNDISTSNLMTAFYSNLLDKGMSLPAALAKSKKDLIKQKEYSHPFYWAPFVLIGK